MKILVTQITEDWQGKYLAERLPRHQLVTFPTQDLAEIPAEHNDAEVLCIFVNCKVDAEALSRFQNLKLVATRSTGFDHVDLAAAKAKGVVVMNVPFYGENTVAEHTMALILALSRSLKESIERIEDAQFNYEGLRGWDLKDRQIGIVGGGHIGMHVARMARGFEMKVVVYDLKQDENLASSVGFKYASLEELLKTSDVITLHLPLNDHTHHIIGSAQFEMMKPGVYLVNTARGGLVDTDALFVALRSGKVAGVGLDVLEEEDSLKEEAEILHDPNYRDKLHTILENHILMEMENVILTPHNAFNSQEAVERILQTTVENIQGFANGVPQNVVTV